MVDQGASTLHAEEIGTDGKDREGFVLPGWYAVDTAGAIMAGPYAAEANCVAKIAEMAAKQEGTAEKDASN